MSLRGCRMLLAVAVTVMSEKTFVDAGLLVLVCVSFVWSFVSPVMSLSLRLSS